MIIDFHTHIFPDKIAESTVKKLGNTANIQAHTDGTLNGLSLSMKQAGVDYSVVLPVATNVRQVSKINDTAAEINQNTGRTGILSFGGIHPETEDYKAELKRIKALGLLGIKLHPNYQETYIDDIKYLNLIDYAVSLGLVVVVHAGIDIGLPEPVYCTPLRVNKLLEEVKPEKLVLAHMGGFDMWDEVEAYLVSKQVYFDTAFTLGKRRYAFYSDDNEAYLMDRELFIKTVKLHGADKILFASDSPWGSQAESVSELKRYALSNNDLQRIFSENAKKLIGI